MIYINWNNLIMTGLLILAVALSGCNKIPESGTGSQTGDTTQDDQAEEDHSHEKMVHLNEAQYLNAGIDTGWFEMKNMSEVINANGYTKLPPQNQAEVSIQIRGTIQSIKVIEGEYVKAGQTLATLHSLEYNNMRLEREKMLEQLHASEAALEYLRLEYDRQKELSEENVTATKVFQKVSADLKSEQSKVEALKNQISIMNQNIRIGGNSASPTILIYSPINGHITDVDIMIGSTAEPGKPLFRIVDNSKMHVDLLVYEKDLFKVRIGQNVRFILTNQNNKEINGKIFSIGKSFESETKSVAVHADIKNNEALIPGMYVNALIDVGANMVTALPLESIIKVEGREFIFLWEKENLEKKEEHDDHGEGETVNHAEHEAEITFARIEVKTGPTQLGYVQVTPLVEIHDGDKIVLKGAYYLQSHLLKTEGGGAEPHSH